MSKSDNCERCEGRGYISLSLEYGDITICPVCKDNVKFTKRLREIRGLSDLSKVREVLDIPDESNKKE